MTSWGIWLPDRAAEELAVARRTPGAVCAAVRAIGTVHPVGTGSVDAVQRPFRGLAQQLGALGIETHGGNRRFRLRRLKVGHAVVAAHAAMTHVGAAPALDHGVEEAVC